MIGSAGGNQASGGVACRLVNIGVLATMYEHLRSAETRMFRIVKISDYFSDLCSIAPQSSLSETHASICLDENRNDRDPIFFSSSGIRQLEAELEANKNITFMISKPRRNYNDIFDCAMKRELEERLKKYDNVVINWVKDRSPA